MKRLLLLLCLLLVGVSQSLAQSDWLAVPELRSPVTDLTAALTQEQVQALERKLLGFEQSKGAQIAVLLVNSTAPETIEQYSIRVVEQWKLGRHRVDDGVLLLVAVADRRLRIEVAYGLEGALTDLVSKRIIDGIIVPEFRRGQMYAGIDAGVDAIIKVVSGEQLPAPGDFGSGDLRIDFLVAPVIILLCFSSLIRPVVGTRTAALVAGALGIAGGAFFLPFIAALFLGAIVTLLSWAEFSGGSGSSRGGFYSSSRGGSSSYSGGGGSFGGGGASGRW